MNMFFRYCWLILVILLTAFKDLVRFHLVFGLPLQTNTDSSESEVLWNKLKGYSRDLNDQTMEFYRIIPKPEIPERSETGIPRILCDHHCGPEDLIKNKTSCLQRIYLVLHSYRNGMHQLNQKNMEEILPRKILDITSNILNTTNKLLECLEEKGYSMKITEEIVVPKAPHLIPQLMEKIAYRLTNVTPIIARVFSPGDPSSHGKN